MYRAPEMLELSLAAHCFNSIQFIYSVPAPLWQWLWDTFPESTQLDIESGI